MVETKLLTYQNNINNNCKQVAYQDNYNKLYIGLELKMFRLINEETRK